MSELIRSFVTVGFGDGRVILSIGDIGGTVSGIGLSAELARIVAGQMLAYAEMIDPVGSEEKGHD